MKYVGDTFSLAPFVDPSLFVDAITSWSIAAFSSVSNDSLSLLQREDTINNNNFIQPPNIACSFSDPIIESSSTSTFATRTGWNSSH